MEKVYMEEVPKGFVIKTSDFTIIGTGEGAEQHEGAHLQEELQV